MDARTETARESADTDLFYNATRVDPDSLARQIETFLAEAPEGVVREDGQVIFNLKTSHYSVSAARGRCLIHLWSDERNAVRCVLDSALRRSELHLTVQRLGHPRPALLTICRNSRSGTSVSGAAGRRHYARFLQSVLRRYFPDWTLHAFTSAMDLERSFGPAYTRGVMRHAGRAFAVTGVCGNELPATVCGALTVGILWLDRCRQQAPDRVIEGLRLFVPAGMGDVIRARMSCLNRSAAKWELFELDERSGGIEPLTLGDHGNIQTRLTRCPNRNAVQERFACSIAKIRSVVPEAEILIRDEQEVLFRWHGIEFARVRIVPEPGSFRRRQEVTFGSGDRETELTDGKLPEFRALMDRFRLARTAGADSRDSLWRLQPERWLESLALANPSALDPQFAGSPVYSQVPAFAAADRGLIDMLTCTAAGRLAVMELKADEDLHLPLQGLDYWSRVTWHHERSSGIPGRLGEFQKFGYFSEIPLSPARPVLYLVAPALHIHPGTDTLLRYFAPEIEWTVIGLDERWREKLKVVFRKTGGGRFAAGA